MEVIRPSSRPPFAQRACPRCGRSSAPPFVTGGVCLRCAGIRVLEFASLVPRSRASLIPFDLEARGGLPLQIGDYEIIEELGRGGMARVFAARQIDLGRIVAVKAIATGRGTADLELRFLREAQTIAQLRHPLIVTVHESGRADGFVYFTMDYIEGGDLARRLRAHSITPRESAELLHKVAAALAYTHGQGVLHRDLKPSNILLDGSEPRVADFGLAAQLEAGGDLTTGTGVIGTPHYLAPEALRRGSAALSVASDIYALGVILFEMLTGRTPFAGASPAELAAMIETTEPPTPRLLAPAVPRDIETICLKCLERDPVRRYASATALGDDLRRFLAGEAIAARPPGRIERWMKYARRHRSGFTAALASAVVLVAATGVSAALALRARRAERFAESEARMNRELADFLQNELLVQPGPGEAPDRDVKLRAVLDRAAQNIESRFADRPLVEVEIRETLGRSYARLGDYAAARRHIERACALCREQFGPEHPKTLRLLSELADAHYNLAEYEKAQALAMSTLAQQVRTLGREHPDTLTTQNTLAGIYQATGLFARAEKLLIATLRTQERIVGSSESATLDTMANLSSTYLDEGKFAEAETLLRRMLEICQRSRGPEHPYTLLAMNNLAGALWGEGDFAAAGELHRQNYDISKRIFGAEHPDTLRSLTNVARCSAAEGRWAESAALHRQILEIRRRVLGPEYHDTLRSMSYLAAAELAQHHTAAAEALYRETLEVATRVLGAGHPDTLQVVDGLAETLIARDDLADVEALLRPSFELRAKSAPTDWTTAAAHSQLGWVLSRQQRFAEAEPLLIEGYNGLAREVARIPASSRKTIPDAGARIVQLYTDWERPALAAEWKARLEPTETPVTDSVTR